MDTSMQPGDLHIGHVNTSKAWGGGEHQVMHLVRGLGERGIRSTLFAHPRGSLIEKAAAAGMAVEPLPEIVYMAAPWPCLLPFTNKVRKLGVNFLHIHDSRGLWVGSWLRRWTGFPMVLSRHISSPLRRNRISIWKYKSTNLQAVIAVSDTVREVFAQFGYPEDRIHVVTNGLDIEELAGVERDEAFRREYGGTALIGGIGKLSVKKNWQLLLHVAAHLAGQGHDFRWVLVGDGPERARLEELSRELGISEIIHFLGFREDAVNILRNFDVLFHPSLMEGASITISSAMAIGVPVVSADAPASVESLDGCGWIVGGDDVPGAAAAILEAATDESIRSERCAMARVSAIDRFSIANTVQGTIDVYQSVMD